MDNPPAPSSRVTLEPGLFCFPRSFSNMGESVNTMRYAERAMNIQNTAVKNEDVSGPPVSYAEVRRDVVLWPSLFGPVPA